MPVPKKKPKGIVGTVVDFFSSKPRQGGAGGRTSKQLGKVDTPLSASGSAPPLKDSTGLRPFQPKKPR